MTEMAPLYRREIRRLASVKSEEEKEYRQNRLGEYLMVHFLWGSIEPGLMDEFLNVAPERLRKHVMWFLGNEMRRATDMQPEIRARGQRYWEIRLAAAEKSTNKDHYRGELATIGNWTLDTVIPPDWLLAQMLCMLRAGYTPANSYSVIDWAEKIAVDHVDGTVELLEGMFANRRTEQWTSMTQPGAVRRILELGKATMNDATRNRVQRVIGILATRGDTGFVDLSN